MIELCVFLRIIMILFAPIYCKLETKKIPDVADNNEFLRTTAEFSDLLAKNLTHEQKKYIALFFYFRFMQKFDIKESRNIDEMILIGKQIEYQIGKQTTDKLEEQLIQNGIYTILFKDELTEESIQD